MNMANKAALSAVKALTHRDQTTLARLLQKVAALNGAPLTNREQTTLSRLLKNVNGGGKKASTTAGPKRALGRDVCLTRKKPVPATSAALNPNEKLFDAFLNKWRPADNKVPWTNIEECAALVNSPALAKKFLKVARTIDLYSSPTVIIDVMGKGIQYATTTREAVSMMGYVEHYRNWFGFCLPERQFSKLEQPLEVLFARGRDKSESLAPKGRSHKVKRQLAPFLAPPPSPAPPKRKRASVPKAPAQPPSRFGFREFWAALWH